MTHTMIGYANLAKTATLTATSEVASLPVTNLAEDRGSASLGWQTALGVTTATVTCAFEYKGSTVRAIGIFNGNLTDMASVTLTAYYNGGAVHTETLAGPAVGYRQVLFILPADIAADSFTLAISDVANPDNFLNVGQLFAGPVFAPGLSISGQSTYGTRVDMKRQKSRGGQTYNTPQSRQRIFTFDLGMISDAEALDSVAEIDRIASLGGNILFVPDCAGSYVQKEALFGELTESKDINFQHGARNYRAWGGTISERL